MNEMIDTFANRLNKAINIRNIKPVELAEKTGIDKSKISSYMSGRYKAKQDGIYLLANALDVSEAWLMGLDVPMDKNVHIKQKPKAIKVPVLGYVRAGIPLEAIEEILDYEEIPAEWANDNSEYFGLTVKGDSMFPYIIETDVIIFKKTNTCESGDIAAVLVNGDEATVKLIKRDEKGITLIPFNPMYPKMSYTNEDIINKPVQIIGVLKELRRKNFNT